MNVLERVAVVITGDSVALTKALQGAEASMRQAGERMSKIGKTLSLKVSAPLAAIGAISFKMAADFDASMRKIVGLVGVQPEIVAKWRGEVRKLAVEYGKTAEEAGDALFYITSAGLRGATAMNTLEAALKASAIGMGDAKSIADAATSAMNAYGAENLSATRATEILTAAVRAGKLETESLAPVLGQIISTAAALDISFEQVAGMLAVFSRTGTDAAMGATSLQAIMSSLLGTSKEGQAILEGAGLSLKKLRDVAAGPKGLVEVFRLLDEKLGSNEDKLKMVIPNVRAFRGVMNALAQDTASVNDVLDQTTNSVGIVDKALEASKGPAFRFSQAMAALKEILLSIGDAVTPTLVPILIKLRDTFIGVAHWIENLSDTTKKWLTVIGALVIGIGPLLLALGVFIKLMATLKVVAVVAAFLRWVSAVAALIPMVNSLSAALALLQTAMGPAGWVVLGASAIAAVLGVWLVRQKKVGEAIADTEKELRLYTQGLQAMNRAQQEAEQSKLGQQMSELQATMRGQRDELAALAQAREDELAGMDPRDRTIAIGLIGDETDEQKALREELEKNEAEYKNLEGRFVAVTTTMGDNTKTAREMTAQMERLRAAMSPDEASAVVEAMTDLHTTLKQIDTLKPAAGPEYNVAREQADAYRKAIEALVAANVDMETVVGPEGQTLQDLVDKYQALSGEAVTFKDNLDESNDRIRAGQSAVESALTPQQQYVQTMSDLAYALEHGAITQEKFAIGVAGAQKAFADADPAMREFKALMEKAQTPAEAYAASLAILKQLLEEDRISQEEFNKAAGAAQQVMEDAQNKANELGKEFTNVGERGVNAFVDFATGAGGSFKEFVNSAIKELERLIVKILFVKTLTSFFGGVGGAFGGLFAKGGFVKPGTVGIVGEKGPEVVQKGRSGVMQLVGEKGPELVMAGPSGLTITPFEGKFAEGGFLKPDTAGQVGEKGLELIRTGIPAETFGGAFAKGGFLKPDTVGLVGEDGPEVSQSGRSGGMKLVGEKGPELVKAGPRGLTITPLGGAFAKGGFLAPGLVGLAGEAGVELVQAGRRAYAMSAATAPPPGAASGGGAVSVRLDTSSLPPAPRLVSPDALAADDWWRRAFSALKIDYEDRGGR